MNALTQFAALMSALVAAVAALGGMAVAGGGVLSSPGQNMFDQLASPLMLNSIQASEVLDGLRDIKSTLMVASSSSSSSLISSSSQELKRQVETLIDASTTIDASRCTAENQHWLIRQMLAYRQSPLGAYIDLVRQRQRDYCLASFKARLEAAMTSGSSGGAGDDEHEGVVQEFARFLQESADIGNELYKLNDIPLESLVEALREYIKHTLELGRVPRLAPPASSETPELAQLQTTTTEAGDALATLQLVNEHLMGACKRLTTKYGDFIWMMKIFEPQRPAGLSRKRHERTLWLTKVCKSLQFDSFEMKLNERYTSHASLPKLSRKTVEKFSRLLHSSDSFDLVFNNKLAPGDLRQALGLLANERHYLSQANESEPQLLGQVVRELEKSCVHVTRALADFLWLVDLRLRVALNSRESVEMLRLARVCQLLPELQLAQKQN